MSKEMEDVKSADLWMKPLDENSTKDEEKNKKKKKPSDDDEDYDDEGQDESEEPKPISKPKVNLFEPEILEGKREKKTIQRLYLTSKPKEKLKIESIGRGAKLGDIARINHSIGKLNVTLLRPLHKLLYDRPGTASTLRKNLRLFNGFSFGEDSDLYNKKMEKMKKLPKGVLINICKILDLERSGTQIVLLERIIKFLVRPTNSGKPVLKKKKKTTKDAKREKSSSKNKKTQKKVESGKSKPIVTDSSSDDDDEEEEEEESKKNSKSTEKSASQKDDDIDEKSSDTEEEEDEKEGKEDSEEDEDSPQKEKKSSTKKSDKPPQKKKSPSVKSTKKSDKKSDQTVSDDSEEDFQEEKKTKTKPATKRKAPAKPVPKTKKADSSSNRGKKTASRIKDETESSDDDQPLIKMIKKPPTDEQLKVIIQELLKDANLEEVTMKQITRQVYDKFPDFDLTSRKELIRETVKSLLS